MASPRYLHTLKGVVTSVPASYVSGVVRTSSIDRILRRQHGVISRTQAVEAGLSENQIQHRIQSGSWLRLTSGVYAPAASTPSWERQLNAALLGHPEGIVAGLSAAHLLGFSNIRRGRPEILLPFEGNARSAIARVIRSRHFAMVARRTVEGWECSSPAETVLTLSLRWPYAKLERLIDDGLAQGLLAIHDFNPILDRLTFARQPGLKALRAIVGARSSDAYQPPTSELERLLFRLLDHPQLPHYTRQLPIRYESLAATVDAYNEDWAMIVEGDGRRWHTRKADFELDRQRDNAAVAAGLVVVRFTWKDLRYDPAGCLKTLIEAGKRRSKS